MLAPHHAPAQAVLSSASARGHGRAGLARRPAAASVPVQRVGQSR
jgi:hypothetical protein